MYKEFPAVNCNLTQGTNICHQWLSFSEHRWQHLLARLFLFKQFLIWDQGQPNRDFYTFGQIYKHVLKHLKFKLQGTIVLLSNLSCFRPGGQMFKSRLSQIFVGKKGEACIYSVNICIPIANVESSLCFNCICHMCLLLQVTYFWELFVQISMCRIL